MKKITKKALLEKLKLLDLEDEEQTKDIVCGLIGHSNIENLYFGYHNCGRCGEQVGDSLGSYYENTDAVIIGHNCTVCRENYKKLTWRDKFMTPDPFTEE